MNEHIPIPVIDIFAGPGGLGEGFSALLDKNDKPIFKVALSIEKEHFAHQTLELRSFFRQFVQVNKEIPDYYYKFLRRDITREQLFRKYPELAQSAKNEAWQATLGETSESDIDNRIRNALNEAQNWVLVGGPPCQAYSLVGRSRNRLKNSLNQNDPRVYLYREYYRILAVHNPPVFIMENVKGLLSSKINGDLIFQDVLSDLRDPLTAYYKLHGEKGRIYECPGYNIYSLVKEPQNDFLFQDNPVYNSRDFIIKCEEYGIPQTRHRVILLGIRKDIQIIPQILKKEKTISIEHAIYDLPVLRSGLSKDQDNKKNWKQVLSNFPRQKQLNDIDKKLKEEIEKKLLKLRNPRKDRGDEFVNGIPNLEYNSEWFIDSKLEGFCNHSTRSHIVEDLYRYFFASMFASMFKYSPKLSDFPEELLPNHENVQEAVEENKFNDRFRVQIKNKPATTITSHISKDGHYYIHYDPLQCRSLTVREAARVQTFPDNYLFCGPRTSQYQQVGNAVPPLLAYQIANVVKKLIGQIDLE